MMTFWGSLLMTLALAAASVELSPWFSVPGIVALAAATYAA